MRNFSARIKEEADARAKGRCEKCGGALKSRRDYHYDHIKPHAMGGPSTLENCQILCTPCHVEKSISDDLPTIRSADAKGKVAKNLIVAAGVSEIARRFGVK